MAHGHRQLDHHSHYHMKYFQFLHSEHWWSSELEHGDRQLDHHSHYHIKYFQFLHSEIWRSSELDLLHWNDGPSSSFCSLFG